jgi:hydrogenase maturation protease
VAEQVEVLVLGIGNLLWADEGFGVRCAEMLAAEYDLSPQVLVLDGGTQGLYLLPYVQQARRLIVFDAVDYGLPAGTLKIVEGDEVPRFMGCKKMSLHQTGFQEVISAASLTGQLPEEMLLIGVQPVELDDFGGSLRPEVKIKVAEAVGIAVERLQQWGYDVRRCAEGNAERINNGVLSIEHYEAGRPSADEACRVGDERFL